MYNGGTIFCTVKINSLLFRSSGASFLSFIPPTLSLWAPAAVPLDFKSYVS